VSPKARAWTEDSLEWLRQEFGDAPLLGDVLVPESLFPPGSYTGTEADLQAVLRKLCARMSAPIDAIRYTCDCSASGGSILPAPTTSS
jgi:hypothetical protein